jgi:hypothetical protein
MKYLLDDVSPTLTAIAHSLAAFGAATEGYAEEIKTIERVLRQLYPDESPKDPFLFAAVLAVNAMVLGIVAVEIREIGARAEKRNAERAQMKPKAH